MEELASHDTAAAWTLFNPLDWAFFCARLPDEGAEEIYSNSANILIAAQFGRPLHATPSQNGYRINGRAPFVSNSYAGVKRVPLPPRSPRLNAYAERWVKSIKDEALAKMILFGEGSLRHVLSEYLSHDPTEQGAPSKRCVTQGHEC
jgi:hypothetical protein